MCFLGLFTSGKSQNSILWTESQGSTSLPGKTFVATDLIGNIYVASSVNGTALDWIVSSYRPDSVLRWTFDYFGDGNLNDIVTGIVVVSSFNVFVCGTTEEASTDITLVKLDSAGVKKWVLNYDSGDADIDLSSGLAESGDYIYLSGSRYKPSTGYNYQVVKVSKAGAVVWENEFNGTGNNDDFISDVDVDAAGNVYVTGKTITTSGNSDFDLSGPENYFANFDAGFMNAYWTDNVITVGFSSSSSASVFENYVEFYADNSGSVCPLSSFDDIGPLACVLSCVNSTDPLLGDGYETVEKFSSPYAQGTKFLIHVQARFLNGESIDQCAYWTTNTNLVSYDRTTVMIRGGIEDFNSSLVSYKIEVYETIP